MSEPSSADTPEPVSLGVDRREVAALVLTVLGTLALTTAGFLLSVPAGLAVLGGILLGLGVLLALS